MTAPRTQQNTTRTDLRASAEGNGGHQREQDAEPPNRVDLRKLLLCKQQQLGLDLQTGREAFDHPGEKGSASENAWHGRLRQFLPARYAVAPAFVIDADGYRSEHIDLVVYDQHFCPTVFEQSGKLFVPAESVFAAFEIKQDLSREHVEYACAKIASVRRLRRTSTTIVDRGQPRKPREPFHILGGLLAYQSSWTPPLGEPLRRVLAEHAAEGERLDLGYALQHGAFEVAYPGDGSAIQIDTSDVDGALIYFQFSLFRLLQAIGSPMAIDLKQYARPIETQRQTPDEIHIDPAGGSA